jgi:hypothetical protein
VDSVLKNTYCWLIEMKHHFLTHCQAHCQLSSSLAKDGGFQSETSNDVLSTVLFIPGVLVSFS